MDKSDTLKKRMLEELLKSKSIISSAALSSGISRQTHYRWLEEDQDYAASVSEITESAIDFVESMLLQKIESGDTASIIFFLKTRARSRGYSEKVNFEPGKIKITVHEKIIS